MAKLCARGKAAAKESLKSIRLLMLICTHASKLFKGKIRKRKKKENEFKKDGHLKSGLILPIKDQMVHILHVVDQKVRKEETIQSVCQ